MPLPFGRHSRLIVIAAIALTVFQAVGTRGASLHQPEHRDFDALALAIAVAGPPSLLLLPRLTRTVMWWVAGITAVYLLRDYGYGPVFASLGIATVGTVVAGRRATAWTAMATLFTVALIGRVTILDRDWDWTPVLGMTVWMLLALAIAELVRSRRERATAAKTAARETARRVENEQNLRIARDLHDVVAHHISLINVQAGVALHVAERNPEQAVTALTAIKNASKEALVELRGLVGVLRDEDAAAPRAPGGRLDALDDLIERTSYAGLRVTKQVTGTPLPLPAAVELAALRIIQEAITNTLRHADATSAEIRLEHRPDALAVSIDDDGRGLPTDLQPGSGLTGMQERAALLGGTLEVGRSALGGTRIEAVLPLGSTQ